MFSSLKQGSLLYILEKGFEPNVEIAEVVSTTEPPFQQSVIPYGNSVPSQMDVTVKTNKGNITFNKLNSTSSTESYDSGKIVISETKEPIITEIDTMRRNSQSILDNVDKHQSIVEKCDVLLKELNPQYAKEAEREQRLGKLEETVGDMGTKLDKVLTLLSKDK